VQADLVEVERFRAVLLLDGGVRLFLGVLYPLWSNDDETSGSWSGSGLTILLPKNGFPSSLRRAAVAAAIS
jgi:hypothetical protein